MSKCEYSKNFPKNHSNDIVEVYHGSTTPTVLCGFHASIEFPER